MAKYTIQWNEEPGRKTFGDFSSKKAAHKALKDRGWVQTHPPEGFEFLLQRAGYPTLSAKVVWQQKPYNIEDLPSKSN